jgi:hypothetical protein
MFALCVPTVKRDSVTAIEYAEIKLIRFALRATYPLEAAFGQNPNDVQDKETQ